MMCDLTRHAQTPRAVGRLQGLLKGPTPQLIRIGVRNKGCAGLSYHLEYVESAGKFDEVVEQDGVRVLIDSKALFSIIGSEMDWTEDALRCVVCLWPGQDADRRQLQVFIQESQHYRRMWMWRVFYC